MGCRHHASSAAARAQGAAVGGGTQNGSVLLSQVARAVADVTATGSRKDKSARLAAALREAGPGEQAVVVSFLAGETRQRRTGLGPRSLTDLPSPAATSTLTVADADDAFAATAAATGPGSGARRLYLLRHLMARATEPEQRLLAGLVTGELRQGAARGVLVEAVAAAAAGVTAAAVRRALTLDGDLVRVAETALTGGAEGLAGVRLHPGRPLAPMLAASAPDLDAALERTGPAGVEWKLDGVRVQLHRWQTAGEEPLVGVWTRSLDDVTDRLPEVTALLRALPARDCVLDGEVVALDGEDIRSARPLPFQQTAARVARHGSGPGPDRLPLATVLFDVLHLDGEDLLDAPAHHRRAVLETLAGAHAVPRTEVDPADPAEREAAGAFVADGLARGHEGVVVKALGAPYAAGRRGAAWVKVKPRLTLDLVVLAAEWGHGRRTGTLSNLHLGARDPHGRYGEPGGHVMLGKTFKGLTDAMLGWQTERLTALATGGTPWRVDVRPELVVEVAFDGVQVSPRYPAGMALRFARVVRHRPDKDAAGADTVEDLETVRGW